MAVVSTTTLKTYFETGDRPTEANFIDLIDTLSALPASSAPTSISEITQALPFTGNQVMGIDDRDVQSGAYSFTLAGGGTAGYVIQVYIQADGSNTFTFSSDFVILNSSITSGGTLTADVTYQFWFFFDGDKVSVNVVETNAAAIDVTAPTLTSATIEAASDSVLNLVFDEAVTITTAGWSIATTGAALSISAVASGSGTTTPKFTLSRSVLSTETVTLSYASSTGNTVDGSGNELADITDRAVTNNVSALLLDSYTGAKVAYGLTKLRSAYSGSAIRVRRDNDDAEQDIGFDGNNLDESALTTFVGANNGYITIRYDQSGNGENQTQTTKTAQPLIVASGSINKINSMPSMVFNGTTRYMTVIYSAAVTVPATYFLVNSLNAVTIANTLYSSDDNATRHQTFMSANDDYRFFAGTSILTGVAANTNQVLLTNLYKSGANSLMRRNGSQIGSTSDAGSTNSSALRTGSNPALSSFSAHNEQLVVVYDSDQSANFAAIETIINGIYSIY